MNLYGSVWKRIMALGVSLGVLGLVGPANSESPNLEALGNAASQVLLNTEYHPLVERPLQYVGFSFDGPVEELEAMQAVGANAVGTGGIWQPVPDPEAPDGLGFAPPPGTAALSQRFTAEQSFDAVAAHIATMFTNDSGCVWRLYGQDTETGEETLLAEGVWRNLADNSFENAEFETQPPGSYRFELDEPVGSHVAWWARQDAYYEAGGAYRDAEALPGRDFQFRLRVGGNWEEVVPPSEDHSAVRLGPSPFGILENLGMKASYQLGNWNNPGFNYYPLWFFEQHPEAKALDQYGEPILGGSLLERESFTPNIESAVIKYGTRRFMEAMINAYKDSPALLFYVLGGEELYATYMDSQRWTDYSPNALQHFRAWLETKRYGSVDALNAAWESDYPDFDVVDPSRGPLESQRWLDWLDFRFESMGERIGFHYQTVRHLDSERLAFTCNHGSLFHHDTYAAMGARLDLYSAQSDGFETGQIIEDNDPEYYNIKYMETLLGFGKPYAPVRLAYKKSDPAARGGGTSYTPEAVRRYGYESLGGGAWNLGFIQWSGSLPDGEWGVVGTPAEDAIKTFNEEIAAMAPALEGMHPVRPRVAVYLSHETWALRGYQASWRALHQAAIERQVPKVYVYDTMLKHDQVDAYPWLVSLDNGLIDAEALAGLRRYVEAGGKLLIAGFFPEDHEDAEALRTHTNVTLLRRNQAQAVLNAMGDDARPVNVQTRQRVQRLIEEDITGGAPRVPVDLAGNRALGQTVRVSGNGLHKIAIQMPTFTNEPPIGFLLEIRRDNPRGAVIEEFHIPKQIGDNSWVEVELSRAPALGDILYIGIQVPGALPEQHLGWWTSAGDVYPTGNAWLDGRPVNGDRFVRLVYRDTVRAREAIEVFQLSDGLNQAVVLINTAPDPVQLEVDVQDLLPEWGSESDFGLRAQLRPADFEGAGMQGEVTLPAQDAEVLFLEWRGEAAQAEAMQSEAAAILGRWEAGDALTNYHRHLRTRLAMSGADDTPHKALAAAVNVATQLGLRVDTPEHIAAGDTATLRARFYDADGNPVALDRAFVDVTPSQGVSLPLEMESSGVYTLALSQDLLPALYDYAAQAYAPYTGPARLRVYGEVDGKHASALVDVEVGDFTLDSPGA